MEKKMHNLLSMNDIKLFAQSLMGDDYNDQKLYKMIYTLKNKWHLISIKKDTFFIKKPEEEIEEHHIVERFYRSMFKQHCKNYTTSARYIGGIKALEIHMNNYSIPDDILVITKDKQANEVIMFDKKVTYKMYTDKKQNIFWPFYKLTQKVSIHGTSYPIATKELSILEALYNTPELQQSYVQELVKKALKNYKKYLDPKQWITILKQNKHHTSINRLYTLSHHIDPQFAESIKEIIKKYSYFI